MAVKVPLVRDTTTNLAVELSASDTIAKSSVGLGNVDNTSDVSKPVSTPQQTALNAYALKSGAAFTGNVSVTTSGISGLSVVSSTTNSTGLVLSNTSSGGHAWTVGTSGSAGPTAAGTLLLYDNTSGGVQFTVGGNACSVPGTFTAGGGIAGTTGTFSSNVTITGGTLNVNRTASDYNVINLINTSGVQVQLDANGNSEGNLRTVTNHPLTFMTNNTLRLTLPAAGDAQFAGNVGLGTLPTSAPSIGNTVQGANNLVMYNAGDIAVRMLTDNAAGRNQTYSFGAAGVGGGDGGMSWNSSTRALSLVTGATPRVTIDVSGNSTFTGNIGATGTITANGSASALYFSDRTTPANLWAWYTQSAIARLYSPSGDRLTVDNSGNLAAVGSVAGTRALFSSGGTNSAGSFTASGSSGVLSITDTGVNGAGLLLAGNGATTPNKTIRAQGGNLQFVDSAYSAVIATLTDAGALTTGSTISAPSYGGAGVSQSNSNSTLVQRTASGYVSANYFNTTANDIGATVPSSIAVQTGSDNFIRWQTPANFIAANNLVSTTNNATIINTNAAGYDVADTPAAPAAAMRLCDSGNAVGNGGTLMFGANSTYDFAYIKGYVTNGSTNSTGRLVFGTRTATTDASITNKMVLDAAGNLTISPGSSTAVDHINTSDIALKDAVANKAANPHLADLLRLCSWLWKANGNTGQGVIAQEAQRICPEYVYVGIDGMLGVDKAGIALEAVIGLATRVRELESRL